MTAYALKPNFADLPAYGGWLRTWRATYNRLTADIRRQKMEVKEAQRTNSELARRKQRELHFNRRVALKMMTLLQDGRVRRDRLRDMLREIAEQPFPLRIDDVRNVDMHYNRGHTEFAFLPMWVIRAKGRSYYVNQIDFDVPCTTKERATGSTKGVLRFKRCSIEIDRDGNARITKHLVHQNHVDEITVAA